MLSIFTFAKPFRGHIGVIQRNAIGSWKQLRPQCEIFLFGDENGTAEVAKELEVRHVGNNTRNEFGTPVLSDVFTRGEQLARNDLHCYVNCDIILGRDFIPTIERVSRWRRRFLLVGQCWDLQIGSALPFHDPTWEDDLWARQPQYPSMRGVWAIDYFVFTRGIYHDMPPFVLGRAKFDNWLLWRATDLGVPVVDATRFHRAIHQYHDYSHLAGGKDHMYYGEESMRNLELAGGEAHCYGIQHSTHMALPGGIKRNWARYWLPLEERLELMKGRARTRLHPIIWRMEAVIKYRVQPAFWRLMERTRPARHALGLNGRNLSRLINLHRKSG